MKKKVIIGLCGLTFGSGNKGCEALAYSFDNILKQIAREKNLQMAYIILDGFKEASFLSAEDEDVLCSVSGGEYVFDKLKCYPSVIKYIRMCDVIFDFTNGDSFTDMYGKRRMFSGNLLKSLCIMLGKPLVLGPQTYGPFASKWSRNWSSAIIRKCIAVYARDWSSENYVEKITKKRIDTFIDVAFALPYEMPRKSPVNDKVKVGMNVSGLLWSNGYTGDNEFGMTLNYREYCYRMLDELLENGMYEIHLIPHVINDVKGDVDDDVLICHSLKDEFPKCVLAPSFRTPMEAKSYISDMEVLVGARMHATIAAFSAGVPVVPVAYSRKFNGLYDTLDYPYYIDGRAEMTQDAVSRTLEYIGRLDELRKRVDLGNRAAEESLRKFKENVTAILDVYSW